MLSEPGESLERIVSCFESAWNGPAPPRIEDHLPPAGAPHRLAVLVELVHVDRELRRKAGEAVPVAAYLERFPELSADPRAVAGLEVAGLLARPAETPGPGHRVGPYELLERLGGGGMGEVFRARHGRLKKEFALKVLSPQLARDPEAARRFERETEALGRLEHPHLVRATDAGVSGGTPYLVMELLAGTDLARLTKRLGPWPVAEACEAARQAALGLQHAHERGLVHRDVKPGNLWLTPGGVVKVLDLGLARLCEAADGGGLTGAGRMMGTPDYVAPEQVLDSRAADARADLYGLGCTLYHLLAGAPPFADATHPTTARKHEAHLREPPPDLRALRAGVPAEVAALLGRLLAKRPEGRPASAAEVAAALLPLAQGSRLGDLLEPGQAPLPAAPTVACPAPTRPPAGRMSRRRWLALAGGLAASGGLGWAGWAWLHPGPALAVRKLRVLRFPDGELGKDTFRTDFEDKVRVEVELSGPAYAYLLALNPAEKPADLVQLCPRGDEDKRPGPRQKWRYPDPNFYQLNDGAGLQAFVVLASRRPLPPYAEWQRQAPAPPWKRVAATAGFVWKGDRERLEPLLREGDPRGIEVAVPDAEALEALRLWLRSLKDIEAAVFRAFAVSP
jgi:hypothetical protein